MSRLQQFTASRSAVVGLVMLMALCVAAALAPWLTPQDPYDLAALHLEDSRLPPGSLSEAGIRYWLGTDLMGRDVLSAIFHGLRMSLLVGLASGIIAFVVGTAIGLFSAYKGGKIDSFLMRVVDLQLSFPSILVALILLSVLGKGVDKIVLALVVVQWAMFARIARATALTEAGKAYTEAARTLRLSTARILFRHLLPNCLPALTVVAAVQVASAISLEATLSFLGIGIPVTEPSLGLLIANGFQFLLSGDYWISVFPGVALVMLVGSLNLVADQFRVMFNPRLQRASFMQGNASPEIPARKVNGYVGTDAPVLMVENLSTHFFTEHGVVQSVDQVSLRIERGEILGLVGESGSGKSVTGRSIMRMIGSPGRIVEGQVRFNGEDVLRLDEEAMRNLRGNRIAMVFQDPMMTLNPVLRIDTQMMEAVRAHRNVTVDAARSRALTMLERVGIPAAAERLRCYPHQLSGGMRQRVAIAIALMNDPELIIADEPTTALDVTIQSQILGEFQALARSTGTAVLWISHDLGVVSGLADRIAVMYRGQIVETGLTQTILATPAHPYTRGLLDSMPSHNSRGKPLKQITGSAPSPTVALVGCAFRPRCDFSSELCQTMPLLSPLSLTQTVRCHHPIAKGERNATTLA